MTDRYAVIGHPIRHSKSPQIHRRFAEQTGQDLHYEAIEAPLDGLAATLDRLRKEGYRGCNITVPFKFEACSYAARLSERARSAQAVNTLRFDGADTLGDNTDGAGLVADIERNLGLALRGRRVLLLGAGGAAWGVTLPLLQTGCTLAVANRTVDNARELAAAFMPQHIATFSYAELVGQHFDLLVNATSAGLQDNALPLDDALFAPDVLAYDMMYGRETPFMAQARHNGARVADGLGMLVEQAAEAFLLWRGVRPDTAPVLKALRQAS